eukprot:3272239-Rhodomonas_salina.1
MALSTFKFPTRCPVLMLSILPISYAMSGAEINGIILRASYAVSGTDIASRATRRRSSEHQVPPGTNQLLLAW